MSEQLFTKENRKALRDLLAQEVPGVPLRVQFKEEKDRRGYGFSDQRKVSVNILQVCTTTIYLADPLRKSIYAVVSRWYELLRLPSTHIGRYRERLDIVIIYSGAEAKRTLSLLEILTEITNYNSQHGKLILQPEVFIHFKERTVFAVGVLNQERTIMHVIEFIGNAGFCKKISLLLEQGRDIREALLDNTLPSHAMTIFNL